MAAPSSIVPEFVVYYDPWAAGDHGPHIRLPNEPTTDENKDLPSFLRTSRDRLSLDHGMAVVKPGSREEEAMRSYLQGRGFNPDAYKGDDMGGRKMRCQCGFETGNAEAATGHKAKWPDHDIQLVH